MAIAIALSMLVFILKEIDPDQMKIYDILAAHHSKNPKVKEICANFVFGHFRILSITQSEGEKTF